MEARVYTYQIMDSSSSHSTFMEKTLYDLIGTVIEEVEPGEKELVVPVVLDLVQWGKAKWELK